MKNTDIVSIEVDVNQVPSIIQEQFDGLRKLRNKVQLSTQKADTAQTSAQEAAEKSVGLGHKKEAIECLQSATVDLADAQIAAAEAQEVSFEYQQKIGEMDKYLFALGVSNIAINRSVVQELELKLKGASEKELDEFARKEIISVVKQLKAQEDIINKQSELSKKVRLHESELIQQQKASEELAKELQAQSQKNKEQDKKLDAAVKKDREQDKVLAEQAKKDKEHDRL